VRIGLANRCFQFNLAHTGINCYASMSCQPCSLARVREQRCYLPAFENYQKGLGLNLSRGCSGPKEVFAIHALSLQFGGSSSHALGVFRLGSLRKFYKDSAAVPSSSLANSPPSDPSTMMDQSSMRFCVGKENPQGTKVGHVDTDAKAQLEVP
jgi:hypothetical protein